MSVAKGGKREDKERQKGKEKERDRESQRGKEDQRDLQNCK